MTNSTPNPSAAADRTVVQLQEFTDRAAEAGRQLGNIAVDTYAKAVADFVDLEQRAAAAANNALMKAAIAVHAQFVEDVNGVYIKAMRQALRR